MSGVVIAGALLEASAPLVAVVQLIKAWALPQGSPLPSIVVTRPSRVGHQFLAPQRMRLITERVQVTVRAANGDDRGAILGLAERACVDRTGAVAGFSNVAVLFAGGGPDFMDDAATIFMGSFDLRISFNEPA